MTTSSDAAERSPNAARDDSATTGLAAVQAALAERPRTPAETSDSAPVTVGLVARGDIRVVEPLPWMEGRRRLAIVRRSDAEHDSADVMLAHPWPELATDTDAVIANRDSGLPHPLVVECYVRGPVWLLQVRERVGFLSETILQAIGAAVVYGRPEVEGVQTGLPLAGPADPRWRFKEDEVLEWSTLTDDCASALLAGDDPWLLEPERLQPHTYGATSDPATPQLERLLLAETVHLLATREATVDVQDLDPEALDPDQWAESLGRDRGMVAYAALRPTLDRALSVLGNPMFQEAA